MVNHCRQRSFKTQGLLESFWNAVSAKTKLPLETPNAWHALLGLEDVVDGNCSDSSELKDAPVIAFA